MMHKIITSAILFLLMRSAIAQKGIDGLIRAEKNFAAYSVAHSTKEAFLQFMDSSSLVFDNGKAVHGIAVWEKKEKNSGVLNWRPLYAGISASGDLGYTTGPWTYQSSAKDTIVARGQYTTVWHINKNGEWKFMVDLGVNNTPEITDTTLKILSSKKNINAGSLSTLLRAEKLYNKVSLHATTAADGYISSEAIVNRNGKAPQDGKRMNRTYPDKVEYTIDGSGIAVSNDLGYVYGTSLINGKKDNYLRIWQKERSGWKIAVEVLRY
jgi:ketosteroid isomerase-like protein